MTAAAAALGLVLIGCPGGSSTNSDYGTSSTDTGTTTDQVNADYGTSSTDMSDSDTGTP